MFTREIFVLAVLPTETVPKETLLGVARRVPVAAPCTTGAPGIAFAQPDSMTVRQQETMPSDRSRPARQQVETRLWPRRPLGRDRSLCEDTRDVANSVRGEQTKFLCTYSTFLKTGARRRFRLQAFLSGNVLIPRAGKKRSRQTQGVFAQSVCKLGISLAP